MHPFSVVLAIAQPRLVHWIARQSGMICPSRKPVSTALVESSGSVFYTAAFDALHLFW